MQKSRRFKIPAAAIVALSFLILIMIGTALLCLPVATRSGRVNFLDALFTATSATCVTGLTVVPTYGNWTLFGQIIILLLIQIGGLGFITIISLFTVYIKKHASLYQRKLAMQSAGSISLLGIKNLVKIILLGTLIFEFCGAFLLCFSFVPVYGWGQGIWQAIFTSVSAFCNAGFTITDYNGGVSLMPYISDPLVILVVSLLIIVGGLGFFVWGDIIHHGIHIRRYSFHTKLVLSVTGILIFAGWIFFALFEWNNPGTIGNENAGTKILASLFMSVTPRTAGFNSVDYANMSGAGNSLTTLLMFIGGSPGSTAGGVKTTTVAVFILTMITTARRRDEIHLFRRRVEGETSSQASAIICVYMFSIILSVMIICALERAGMPGEDVTAEQVLFEVVSAAGTVGLSCNITAGLHVVSKIILVLLMFFGRVGGFTLMLIFAGDKKPVTLSRVPEKIIIG